MPLPTDPKTIFLGGLFLLACMATLYVASEIVLPLILAIVLKLLLQPFVRLLERIRISSRRLGALVLSVLLVLLVFGGARSACSPARPRPGPASYPKPFPKIRDSLGFLHEPIDDSPATCMKQIPGFSVRIGYGNQKAQG